MLGIGVVPITWPIYKGHVFRGIYHRLLKRVYLFDASHAGSSQASGAEIAPFQVTGLEDASLREELDAYGYDRLREEADLLEAAGDAFDREKFEAGEVSPMFYGSAMNNFGLAPFLDTFCELSPTPTARDSSIGLVSPEDEAFSGFVFKIQANMDKAHRDRVAFVRICSGRFERGMKVLHVRTDKTIRPRQPDDISSRRSGPSWRRDSRVTSSASTTLEYSRSAIFAHRG